MKNLTTIAALATVALLSTQATQAAFTANDLYIGMVKDSAQSDYIIDIGPGSVFTNATTVVDLSSYITQSTFTSIFSSGAKGVSVGVVGGANVFPNADLYVTQVRSALGTPAVAGSTPAVSGNITKGVVSTSVGEINGNSSWPTAGQSLKDTSKSFTTTVGETTAVPNSLSSQSGMVPFGVIGTPTVIYEDLYRTLATSSTTTPYQYIGYFTVDFTGSTPKLTYTPSSLASSAPVASFTGSPTNGFVPLRVGFTNSATGSITNYVWNFGNGTVITNTTGISVTNTYAVAGTYTVSLAVYGSGGANTNTLANYIVASPTPKLSSVTFLNGKLVLSGTNGPAGVQYRILTATNLTTAIASWTPVLTNTVAALGNFGYTNSIFTNKQAFFRLVSP